jgi:hypothetical protein
MPFVFVIAQDWKLRAAVRAELRERGVEALGMESPDDVGRALASSELPAVIVLEGIAELLSNAGIQSLISQVPTVLIASRTEKIPPDPGQTEANPRVGVVLYRPVTIGEIVSRVLALLRRGYPA